MEGGFRKMSLPVWLPGPMFLLRGLFLGDLCPGDLCPEGLFLGRGLCPGNLCPGGISVQGVSVQGSLFRETPPWGEEWMVRILLECFLAFNAVVICKHRLDLFEVFLIVQNWQYSDIFAPYGVGKCKIRRQLVPEKYISRL